MKNNKYKVFNITKKLDKTLVVENKINSKIYNAINCLLNNDHSIVDKEVFEVVINHLRDCGLELTNCSLFDNKEQLQSILLDLINILYGSHISKKKHIVVDTKFVYKRRKRKKESAKKESIIAVKHICLICDREFKNKKALKQHNTDKHPDEKRRMSFLANEWRKEKLHAKKVKKKNAWRNPKYYRDTSPEDAIYRRLPGSFESGKK